LIFFLLVSKSDLTLGALFMKTPTTSPQSGSGIPMTAAPSISGSDSRAVSISDGKMFSPPDFLQLAYAN
jgi:hypothetical protein